MNASIATGIYGGWYEQHFVQGVGSCKRSWYQELPKSRFWVYFSLYSGKTSRLWLWIVSDVSSGQSLASLARNHVHMMKHNPLINSQPKDFGKFWFCQNPTVPEPSYTSRQRTSVSQELIPLVSARHWHARYKDKSLFGWMFIWGVHESKSQRQGLHTFPQPRMQGRLVIPHVLLQSSMQGRRLKVSWF